MGAIRKRWWRGVAVPVALAAAGVAVPTAPAQAAGKSGPYQVDHYAVPAVDAGTPQWVKTWWSTTADVCDVQVTVTGKNVTVSYPSNTGTYTSFLRSANLARNDVDYTAFKVTATSDKTQWMNLAVDVSYVKLPAGTLRPGEHQDVDCSGRRRHRTSTTRLLVLAP